MSPRTGPSSPMLDDALSEVATRLRQSTAIVLTHDLTHDGQRGAAAGQGAAVVWTPDGLLLTNAHVARGPQATVELPDGRRLVARTVARAPELDLAALRVDPGTSPLRPAALGDPSTLRAGAVVLAFGHPLGVSNALALGILHGTRTPHWRHSATGAPAGLLCADIRLAPGNSGGPLADAAGAVVGLNTLVARGLGFAIPVDRARRFAAALVPRPRLGVTVRPVPVRARGRDTPEPALLVLEVAHGLPAEHVGVLSGDVLFALDGHPLHSPEDLLDALLSLRPDNPAVLELGRAGRRKACVLPAGQLTLHVNRAA